MTKVKKERLDRMLLNRGLCKDLRQAAALVMAGQVVVADQRADKPGQLFPETVDIRLKNHSPHVGRGAEKLKAAISHFNLSSYLEGKTVLDIGASTGGFTEICLAHKAARIVKWHSLRVLLFVSYPRLRQYDSMH